MGALICKYDSLIVDVCRSLDGQFFLATRPTYVIVLNLLEIMLRMDAWCFTFDGGSRNSL